MKIITWAKLRQLTIKKVRNIWLKDRAACFLVNDNLLEGMNLIILGEPEYNQMISELQHSGHEILRQETKIKRLEEFIELQRKLIKKYEL